ncbi:MAG: hypothetical protein WED10_15285, partial [Brumimicrobium sp.]
MKILYIAITLLMVTACTNNKKPSAEAINERLLQGEFEMYEHYSSISCDSLQLDSLNTYYNNDSLYTGECFINYPNSKAKHEVLQIYDGKLHGNKIVLSKKGDTVIQNIYNLGKLISRSVAENVIEPCDSLIEKEQPNGRTLMYHYEIPFTGTCQRFFPKPDTNKVYLEIPYRDGVIHGNMIIYDRKG